MAAAARTEKVSSPTALLSRIPLRWRLLSVGLACAALTGLCGGVGILCLRQIHGSMRETTERISGNLTRQHSCVEEAVYLRELVDAIDASNDAKTLAELEQRCRRARQDWKPDVGAAWSDIWETLGEFWEHKHRQLVATAELAALRRSSIATLTEITALTLGVVDDAEFDTTIDIDGAVDRVEQQVERMAGATDQAQAATRAAFGLRSACQEMSANLSKLRLAEEEAHHDHLHEELRALLGAARQAIAELPPRRHRHRAEGVDGGARWGGGLDAALL